jgi:hypothetical protein
LIVLRKHPNCPFAKPLKTISSDLNSFKSIVSLYYLCSSMPFQHSNSLSFQHQYQNTHRNFNKSKLPSEPFKDNLYNESLATPFSLLKILLCNKHFVCSFNCFAQQQILIH